MAPSSKPLARRSVVEMGLTLTTNTLPGTADQLGQGLGGLASAAFVVGGDLRHRQVGVLKRVHEHDLDLAVGELLDRGVHRLRVGGRDQDRVGLLRRDRVHDRRLQIGRELVGALEAISDAPCCLRLAPQFIVM